jgi:ribose transport system substrate-binding protein
MYLSMYRKIIKAGPVSLAIALPADWIKKNRLESGVEIKVEENQNKLIISTEELQKKEKIKIKYDEFLMDDMLEKIFWEQYQQIIIYDETRLPKNLVQKIITLPGFEIIEESDTSITIERILEPSTKTPENITKRCYFLINDALNQNPPKIDKNVKELLDIAKLFRQESRETHLLIELINSIGSIDKRIYDDAYVRFKNTFRSVMEQKLRFKKDQAKELSEFFNQIDLVFQEYFNNNKKALDIAKLYNAFQTLRLLNNEIIKRQSIEILTELQQSKTKKRYTIGICLKNQSNEFWGNEVLSGIKDKIESHKDVEVIIKYPLTDFGVEEQNNILKKYIQKNVDLIIYAPVDPKKLESTLKNINHSKIPLIILDTDLEIRDIKYTYIGFNNYQGGKLTAEYLQTKLRKKNNIIILEGHLKGNFSRRVDGFIKIIGKEHVKILSGDFTGSIAYEKIKEYAQNEKINAIFATSDNMAIGAAQALTEMKIKIPVCGFDATKEGIKAIKNKAIISTINTNPKKLGELAIQTAHDILSGRTVPERIEYDIELVINNSKIVKELYEPAEI